MSTHTDLIKRLRVIANAIADGNYSELTMRIPAEPDRDADIVVMRSALALEALEQQVAAQQAQMYADRKQALVWMDQVAVLTKELDGAKTLAIYYCEQLAAAQAREAKLLEALAMIHLMGMHQNDRTTAQEALALHADDSALQARLKEERERCAEFCEAYDKYDYAVTGRKTLADAIRGLA